MTGVSLDQLLKTPQIMMAIKTMADPGYFFTRFFGYGIADAVPSRISDSRYFGYDVYASTRTMAPATAPDAPPVETAPKPLGTRFVTLPRFHSKRPIYENRIFRGRAMGGRYGTVDERGQKYVGMQIADLVQTYRNSREFMLARMCRGGFGLKPTSGDQFRLCEVDDGAATIVNDYGIPAINKGDLNGIIPSGEGWNVANAPIHEHLMKFEKRQTQRTGTVPRHILMNSTTFAPILENTVLQGIRGTANRIFDTFTQKTMNEQDALSSAYYSVQIGAIPQYQFHIINDGLVPNEVITNEEEQISDANFSIHIPDGYAMILPTPNRVWYDFVSGSELVRDNVAQARSRVVEGFDVWTTPEINPPRYDITAVDNGMPILLIPGAVAYANVWRTGL
jgi:hypothetical protein